jgi:chaperonin GroEL
MSVFFNEDGKINLIEGVKLIGDAVSSTFGPNGRNVVIKNQSGVHITKDGATVASFVNHEDPLVSIGIDII